jgi:hypothetical protein
MPEPAAGIPALSRRSFLRYTAITAGLGTLARIRGVPVAEATTVAAQLQIFSERQARVLAAIVERMVDSGDPSMPAVSDTRAVEIIDHTLTHVDESVQTQLQWLLTLFQYGPVLFDMRLATFTSMTPEDQDAYIRGWARSRFETRRLAFRALKNLAMLGYYSDDATWAGIHYTGPWAPRPRQLPPRESTDTRS